MDKLNNNNKLFAKFFDAIPQAIIWLMPVFDSTSQKIIDFEYAYCNDEGFQYLNIDREQIPGLRLSSTSTLTDDLRKLVFAETLEVYQTGKKAGLRIYNPALNKFIKGIRFKFFGGVLTIIQDITQENRIIQELYREKTFSNSILDATLNGIFVAKAVRNPEGRIVDFLIQRVNPALTRQFSLKRKQVVGKYFLTVFPEARESGIFDLHKSVCETGVPKNIEVQNGQAWHCISSVKLDDGILATFQEITEQKLASAATEKQRNLLASILRHSPAGISVTQVIRDENGTVVDGRIILANEQAAEFRQISLEDYLSKTLAVIDPAIFTGPIYSQAMQTLDTGVPFRIQYHPVPSSKWLELSIAKMDEEHLISIFTDVTYLKEAQLELERSLEELKRSNANLEEFAFAASHDLKEPMRKVRLFSDVLNQRLKGKISAEDRLHLERIEKATKRMTALVDDLLLYSQINQETIPEERVNLNEKVRLVLEDLELMIQEEQALISVDDLPIVTGHHRQLQQLFFNLISNALKYRKPDEAPCIDIRAHTLPGRDTGLNLTPEEMDQSYHLIEIRDNGIGFEQKDAERMFNVFTQLHADVGKKGTGVGLAIVRRVVENHKGYITAEGSPGKGATFKVYLPVSAELLEA